MSGAYLLLSGKKWSNDFISRTKQGIHHEGDTTNQIYEALKMKERENLDYTDQKCYDACKLRWEREPKLKEEYLEFDNFFAFQRADEKGRIRIAGRR